MVSSTFADRLWWARHRAGLGATRLARLVGCAQSLISSLERNNAGKSRINNKFADALNVDPTWLAFGVEDRAPAGFDPEEARRGREGMGEALEGHHPGVNVVRLQQQAKGTPRWANEEAPVGADPAAALQKRLMSDFQDYAPLVGPERTAMFLKTLEQVSRLLSFEEVDGQDQVGAADKGHDRGVD